MDTRFAEPSTVGEILQEEFLRPMHVTQETLARAMGRSRKVVSRIISGRRRISVDEALLLSDLFEVDEDFWLNLQSSHDRWEARVKRAQRPRHCPISAARSL